MYCCLELNELDEMLPRVCIKGIEDVRGGGIDLDSISKKVASVVYLSIYVSASRQEHSSSLAG